MFKPPTGQEVFESLGTSTQSYLTDTPTETFASSFSALVSYICARNDVYEQANNLKLVHWPPAPKLLLVFDQYRDAMRQCNEEKSIAPFYTFCKGK